MNRNACVSEHHKKWEQGLKEKPMLITKDVNGRNWAVGAEECSVFPWRPVGYPAIKPIRDGSSAEILHSGNTKMGARMYLNCFATVLLLSQQEIGLYS